ncbi:MAG: hypothetical protein Q8M19_14060 [Reyranella sp.]|nr:hypothetical protein [Reyranella sp.]
MIAEIVTQLETLKTGGTLRLVEGALSYAAVEVKPADKDMPAAFVVELTETFGPARGMSQAIAQDGIATYAVILWLGAKRVDDRRAATALETLRAAVKGVMFGFSPAGAEGAQFTNAGGRLLAAQDNVVVWQQSFALQFQERQ